MPESAATPEAALRRVAVPQRPVARILSPHTRRAHREPRSDQPTRFACSERSQHRADDVISRQRIAGMVRGGAMTSREVARRVLDRVDRGAAWATLALDGELERSGLADRDRRLAAELVYGVLRHRARIDRALGAHADL